MKWVFLALGLLVTTPLAGQGYAQTLAVGDGEVIVGESLSETAPGYVYVYRKDSGKAGPRSNDSKLQTLPSGTTSAER